MSAGISKLDRALLTARLPEGSVHDDLIARLRRNEPAALGEIYDEYRHCVRAFARRLVGSDELAEDLVHDTFVALPKAVRRYDGGASLRSFVLGVAANVARHHVRSAARRRRALERLERRPAPGSQSPEADVMDRDLRAVLDRALDALPVKQRVVFVLCDVEERSTPEVSRILEVPEGTVRTRRMHARRTLRKRLEREAIHGPR